MDSIFELEIDGKRYPNPLSWSIDSDYLTPTDRWQCVYYSEDDPASLRRIFAPKQYATVRVHGRIQAHGRIGIIQGAGEGSTALSVSGLDYLGQMSRAMIDPVISVKKGETLERIILTAFEPWGVTKVSGDGYALMRNAMTGVTRGSSAPRDFESLTVEDVKAQENDGVFQWANRIVGRHGYTIQPTLNRDEVALDKPDYSQDTIGRLYRDRANGRANILSGVAIRDWESMPSVVVARGRAVANGAKSQSLSVSGGTIGVGSLIGMTGEEIERIGWNTYQRRFKHGDTPTSLDYAPLFFSDKEAKNQAQLDRIVRRKLSELARKTLVYTATINGVKDLQTDAVFAVGCMVRVDDDVEDVHENLWIASRHMSQSEGDDPETELTLWRPGSFVL